MSSPLTERMNLIVATLAARTGRISTRDWIDPANRKPEDLRKGVYTVLSMHEQGYTNDPHYEAQDGVQTILLIGDIAVEPKATPVRSEVEDAEFTLMDEVKDLCRNLPAALCSLDLLSVAQSGQNQYPRGWIVAELAYRP